MRESVRGLSFWAPRVLTILFALFLSLFAFDVFEETEGFLQTLIALLLHLVPTFLVVALLVLAWRWEWIGVIAFLALAIAYVVSMWGRFPWATYAVISGPLLLISALFFHSWRRLIGARTASQQPLRAA